MPMLVKLTAKIIMNVMVFHGLNWTLLKLTCKLTPLQLMDQCYNRITIMYKNKIRVFDPITRPTFQSADLQNCSDKHLDFFHLNVDDDRSWIELTPQITRVIGT